MRILLAVDGSKHSLAAVRCLIEHADWYRERPVVELVTVHLPVPKLPRMGLVVGKNQITRYYAEEGEAWLAPAKKLLGAAGIAYSAHILVGRIADAIVRHAEKTRCDQICIGTRGHTAAASMLLGSTATKVLHIAKIPVLLVR